MVGRLDSCSTQLNGHQVRFLFHSKTKKKKLGNRKFIHLFYPKVSTIILNTVQFETWGAFDHKHSIYISRLLYFVKLEMVKNRPLNRNADNAEINFRDHVLVQVNRAVYIECFKAASGNRIQDGECFERGFN